ncbi:hypothetical protein OROGR_001210 [Orobanche gracilis]
MSSSTSISSLHFCRRYRSFPAPPVCAAKATPHSFLPAKRLIYSRNLSCKASYRRHLAVAGDASSGGTEQEENKAVETVLKLYEAIKNRNNREISNIIAEECWCVSNLVSATRPFLGKKQVLAFFASLMRKLGKNIEFVVQQTMDDGMVVTVSWKLEWNKVPLPLGKGFSVYMCHVYQGKVMIKNVEIFMEPIIHMGPLRLKVISFVMSAMDKLHHNTLFKNKASRRAIVTSFILLFIAPIVMLATAKSP